MLVFSLQAGERFHVGDDVRIMILEVRSGGQVKVGIEAPPLVSVDRDAVRRRKHDEGRQDPR